ncbi:thioredoxin domain-containing protein [Flavobacterium nackdongense]|uniref:Thioredoxin n=1 Tax=Flavobacterium nackdongense TaxID=2547394 RepID=A0A4P6YC71_9FLAO|nr:thioredoxin domain-containing protein [Flavobacterium nackdongense]QBN18404.1 thioredoxin [Flavobacterium nackdongense]
MKFRSLIFISFVTFTMLSCTGQPSKSLKSVDPVTFSKEIAQLEEPQLIDVRTPGEFNAGHILDAENIDWLSNNFVAATEKLDKSQPIFVYCKSGGRSAKAAAKLEELGFKKIYNLEGGIMKWDAAGLSTRAEGEQGEAKPSNKIIGMSPQEFANLLNTDKKVLIDFNAKWCAPCKKMAPYIDKIQKEMADQLLIIRLDADENKTLINEMKIDELPTLLLYKNKELQWKHTGFMSEEDLKKQLQ